ncbi:hypothetical protein F2Q68_00043506 [Brassica cretica]|uniref:AAA+ ATPase domain-containing protein n=1 Tax=Brassica cretica TaxID=69181 RepID=A0A8S9LJU9_BRACR|nr:hypothetical protein F2Q68_00043506 [Brassica cretica]
MGGCITIEIPCDKAVDQTCSRFFGDRNYIHMMKANLGALETAMQKLIDKRNDLSKRVSAEESRGSERLAQVEGWFSRVARIDPQVSDLLDVKPAEINRLCLFGYFSKKCISSCKYGKKVSKTLEEVKELLSEGVFEEVARKRLAPKAGKKHIQTTIGLDSMVGKAWDSIMKPEGRTLGIYGMGGVGKTTLLGTINNKFKDEFDVVIWVVVSKDLQYKSIQDQILRRLRVDKEWANQTEEEKASSIDEILGQKKFVVLLDDLWSDVDLDKIGVPRPTQENKGSKIVFTTRSKEVCRYMRADDELKMDCLSTNEAWELFQNVVGEAPFKKDSEILTLAKQICEKCYGLPAQVKGWLLSVASLDSQVSKKLEEVELLSREAFDKVAIKGRLPKVEQQPIQTTIGLDSMVGKAWDSIMKPERRTSGIYGMGEVGKTTLLTRINNKFKDEFDAVIWVVVSKDLQYKGIQDQILRRLRVDREWEGETEKEKASSIANILGRNKFILLLDDLWRVVDLNKIGVPRPTQENGSKIVFTTRSKEVCSDMEADDKLQIDCLSKNEAWELFRSIVGEDLLKRHPDIPTLAKQICEKCYGLPLALNVIGKAMKYKEVYTNGVMQKSYDGLKEENVKSCFLYCSLFPEDYEIAKEELIEYWISEGFIDGKRDEDGSNNQGHDRIGLLVRAHLLRECEKEFTPAVKMHDVLREMALWIGSTSGKEEEKQCVKSGVKVRSIPDDINWDNMLKVIPGKFFQFMRALVVLDLSHNLDLRELSEEIFSLTSLQYLNLLQTGISSLSVGLKGLRKQISLDLEFTGIKFSYGPKSYEYGKEVSKKLEEVELLSREAFDKVAIKGRLPKVEQQPIQTTIGLDSMVGKAWDSIMKPERRTSGIYGMGEVGKTTLLTRINNKFKDEFDAVIWVVVSKDLQYKGIQDQILRRLRVDREWEGETEKEKASSIANILGRNKFILLLDDLWRVVDLNKIGVPRPTQENGSKIVFTTRSKEVCSDMEADDELEMDCLSTNEAWELFQNVFGEVRLKGHPDIHALAKKICEKCYGLPLAINMIGKAMSCKEDVHEWRDAIDVFS